MRADLKRRADRSTKDLANLTEAAILISPRALVKYSNPAFRRLFAGERRSIIGRTLGNVLPIASAANLERAVEKVFKTGKSDSLVDFIGAQRRWLEFRFSCFGADVLALVFDVTESHRLHQSREITGARSEKMVDRAGMGMARMSLDGRWLDANPQFAAITGYSLRALDGVTLRQLCKSEPADLEIELAALISGRSSVFSREMILLRSSGENFWAYLNIALARHAGGKPAFFVVIVADISERRAAQDSLCLALGAAKIGEWDYDATTDVTRRSKRFNEIFGHPEAGEPWSFQEFLAYTHHTQRRMLAERFRSARDSGLPLSMELRLNDRASEARWVSLEGQSYLSQQGRVVRIAGLVTDISRSKRAGLELEHAKLAAEDANREKSSFLANMSHEIRTPLGAILGFTDVLRDPSISASDRDKYLGTIKRNGTALATLIDDMLDLSKIEAGHLDVLAAAGNAFELTSEVVGLLAVKAQSKNVSVTLDWPDTVPRWINLDLIRLRQILTNVIGNAVKFTDRGNVKIEVTAMGGEQARLCFRVRDTGIGLSAEQAKRLFKPFVQADSSTARRFGGTGLGLALSRRLARLLDGDLVMEQSLPGVGTVFHLTVPLQLASAPEQRTAEESPGDPTALKGTRILLADDSPDNQELVCLILEGVGVRLSTVDNGADAVRLAQTEDYDVILMDMHMPGMDGYAATETLRQAGFFKPILALTANAMRHDRERCLAAGCDDYVSKPIDSARLYRAIGKLLLQTHV